MNLRELQLKELNILEHVLNICESNNILYFMLSGTLLGAVRHKGFIPWDDDIDLGMPREDYERFILIAQKDLPEFLRIQNFKINKNYRKYYSKIEDIRYSVRRDDALDINNCCIWIDIFPLDGMPSNFLKKNLHMLSLLYRRLLHTYSLYNQVINFKKKRKFLEKFLIKIGGVIVRYIKFNPDKHLYHIDSLLKKYPYEQSEYIVNFTGAYKFKEMFPRSYYKRGMMYDFEHLKLRGPVEYDKILTQQYNDYMTPPSEKDRVWHSIIFEDNN